MLLDMHKDKKRLAKDTLVYLLPKCDMKLFKELRDEQITYSQFEARVYAR